jgi:acyl-CoA synthetase (AMP-forming)/AMP-acid ligase II
MLLARLEQHARTRGAGIAIRSLHEDAAIDYASLWRAITHRASALQQAGLGADEVVLIFAPQTIDAIVTFLGCMVAGGIPSLMPLPSDRQDHQHFWQQHRQIFAHLGSGMVVVPGRHLGSVRAIAAGLPLRLLAQEALPDSGGEACRPHGEAGRIALLQHSSGTTGLKKGVALGYEQLERQVAAYAERLGLQDGDRIISWLPLYHDMGLIACLITPLTLGLEVVCLDPFRWVLKPASLFDAIEAHRGTHVWLPNFAFLHLVRAIRAGPRRWDLASVKAFVNCSEACKPHAFDAFLERWQGHGIQPGMLTCCYALAEAVFAVTQTAPGVPARRVRLSAEDFGAIGRPVRVASDAGPATALLSCGAPLAGVAIRLLDEAGAPVAPGCYGEVEVAAPFLFSGYFKDPGRTARALRDGRYRTGDVGMMLDGELYVCGRVDDMIIVNGRNLYAHEIERIAGAVPGVIDGRVAALPNFVEAVGSNQLVIVAESDLTDDRQRLALRGAIGQEVLAAVGVLPAEILVVPRRTIIKTTSGKMDRRANLDRYTAGRLVAWGAAGGDGGTPP